MSLRTVSSDRLIDGVKITNLPTNTVTELAAKQEILVSGTNIKTINNIDLLGIGNILINGAGTVTSVSVTTANGVSGIVDTDSTTPAISITLDNITPTSIVASGTIEGSNLLGTNTGDDATNSQYSGLVSNATHTGDVTGDTILTIADNSVTNAKIAGSGTRDETTFYRGDGIFSTISAGGDMLLAALQTITGVKTFNDATMIMRNVANTIGSSFTNTNTISRTYTLQDRNGTLADNTDLALKANLVSPILITPSLGTPTSGILTNCTGLPVSGIVSTTSTAIGLGSINLGHASDTTISRVASGKIAVEGVNLGNEGILQNSQSAAYTLVLLDAGRQIYHPSADTTARTWTIPSNASVVYPIGTAITFVNDTSAGVITIAILADTMVLAGAGTTGARTLAANGIATALKMTATRWMISGTNLT